jgi:hypothetical protein
MFRRCGRPPRRPPWSQRIVRYLIERVTVTVTKETNQVGVEVRWAGGDVSHLTRVRPVSRYEQLADYDHLLRRIGELRDSWLSLAEVAKQVNAESFRPPKRATRFTKQMLTRLQRRHGRQVGRRPRAMRAAALDEHGWWLSDLAAELRIPTATLPGWARRGWVGWTCRGRSGL